MNKAKSGNTVSVHYVGTFADGTEFDNSRQRQQPLSFTIGAGQLIKGFDQAVSGMTVGESKTITLAPTDAYGEVNAEATQTVQTTAFPPDFEFKVGEPVVGQGSQGPPVTATIIEVSEGGNVTLALNHPLAGKTLNFDIELVSIEEDTN